MALSDLPTDHLHALEVGLELGGSARLGWPEHCGGVQAPVTLEDVRAELERRADELHGP